jgi:hypothetical protein
MINRAEITKYSSKAIAKMHKKDMNNKPIPTSKTLNRKVAI